MEAAAIFVDLGEIWPNNFHYSYKLNNFHYKRERRLRI